MDYNNNDNSNLDNSNDYPNNTYNNNDMNDYTNNSQNDNNLDNGFNNDFNSYNNYNNNFNNPNYNAPNPSNGYAIACLILGIISIPFSCCYGLGIITAVIGIVMGIISRKHNNRKLSGMALAGIICSVLGIVLSIFSIIYYIIIFSTFDFSDPSSIMRQFESGSKYY